MALGVGGLGERMRRRGRAQPRLGVVGCGRWGINHVRVLTDIPNVSVVAAIEPSEVARAKVTARFPNVITFPDLDAALPHIDAVVIATPAETHFAIAREALRHGKDVLVEKPLATSIRDAAQLVKEADEGSCILMVGHTFEFNPVVHKLRNLIDTGALGSILYIHSSRLNLGLHRADVNVVWDLAVHDVSIMNYLLRAGPTSVTAWASRNPTFGVEELAYMRLDYKSQGVTGYSHVSWIDPEKVRELTVIGNKKMAVWNDVGRRLQVYDRGVDVIPSRLGLKQSEISYRRGDAEVHELPTDEPLRLEVLEFLDCIMNGSSPLADGRTGLAVISVLEAVSNSIMTGATVYLSTPEDIRAGHAAEPRRSISSLS